MGQVFLNRPRQLNAIGILFGALLATPLAAQRVEITLREAANQAPVGGAIVRLLGEQGAVAQGLTNELGRLVLQAPVAGSYRLRVDRIGWRGLLTDPFPLTVDQVFRLTVPMDSRRIVLPTLEVQSSSNCEAAGQGGPLATALWEEIRKALTANLITEARQEFPLHIRRFRRELNLRRDTLREWVVSSGLQRGPSFVSLPPAELATRGFVWQDDGAAHFAAPDAALLLSEEFVSTHCFRVVPERDQLAGLAFSAVPGRQEPEVAGTLWVDRATSELRYLEYSYTGLKGLLRLAQLGGRVEFERLPGGHWIVSYWHIRMPRLSNQTVWSNRTSSVVTVLTGYHDEGGRAELAGDTLGRLARAIVAGRVFDSTTGRGVSGAFVGVYGTRDSIVTDEEGRFELIVTASGEQFVTAHHPKLGLLGEPTTKSVLLSLGDTARVEFGVPSLASFVRALCGELRGNSVIGTSRRANGTLAGSQELSAEWATGAEGRKIPKTRSDRRGLFALCELPSRGILKLRMTRGKLTLLEQELSLLPAAQWVELREPGGVDSSRAAFASLDLPAVTSDTLRETYGAAVAAGVVVDSLTGRGLAGVVVRVSGTESDSAVSDRAGRFRLTSSMTGPRTLSVSHPVLSMLQGATEQPALLSLGDTVEVRFAVIAVDLLVHAQCSDWRQRSGVAGLALNRAGIPRSGLLLRAEWQTGDGPRRAIRNSGTNGVFVFCDLPAGAELTLLLDTRDGATVSERLTLERGEYRWLVLRPY